MTSSSRSMQLKEEGNRHFKSGDFSGAEGFYSKAIIADPKNPALYTNRAMARLNLELWESVITDCQTCLALSPDNMKALYFLSQAQLPLRQYEDATNNALRAHAICAATNDKSLSAVTSQVLKCKKERWEAMEKRRIREGQQLELELVAMMERERDEVLRDEADESVRREVKKEWEDKMATLKRVFEKARAAESKRREVPDWAIDDISFGIMVDPVITKTGKSYERASIMEHLRRHSSDPLTREPLVAAELRPNLALKQACEEFLEQNGWAVDW